MIKFILECLYFLAPAGFATLAPQMIAYFKILENLNKPIDFNKNFLGKRIFGDHKTIRGYIVGVIAGFIIGLVQYFFSDVRLFKDHALINYSSLLISVISGILLGLGALVGDSVKSFFKRQLNIASGKSWLIFDQIDFILGAILFSLPIIVLSSKYYLAMILIYLAVHITTTTIGYFTGVKESWI